MITDKQRKYIEDHTLRLEASRRGGGIEIDASDWTKVDGLKITAYQNYLGGGMLGSIQNSINGKINDATPAKEKKAMAIGDALREYFYELTNEEVEEYDEWSASESYEAQQARPVSAY